MGFSQDMQTDIFQGDLDNVLRCSVMQWGSQKGGWLELLIMILG